MSVVVLCVDSVCCVWLRVGVGCCVCARCRECDCGCLCL